MNDNGPFLISFCNDVTVSDIFLFFYFSINFCQKNITVSESDFLPLSVNCKVSKSQNEWQSIKTKKSLLRVTSLHKCLTDAFAKHH
jgi:hypothetical protein